jgi:hypothetical protein
VIGKSAEPSKSIAHAPGALSSHVSASKALPSTEELAYIVGELSSLVKNPTIEELRVFLAELGLQQFLRPLVNFGVDSVPKVASVCCSVSHLAALETSLLNIGMTPSHVQKLVRGVVRRAVESVEMASNLILRQSSSEGPRDEGASLLNADSTGPAQLSLAELQQPPAPDLGPQEGLTKAVLLSAEELQKEAAGPRIVESRCLALDATTVKEPATGIALPTVLQLEEGTPVLRLLGCGVKIKAWGFLNVDVYALGVFAELEGCRVAAASWFAQQPAVPHSGALKASSSVAVHVDNHDALFEALRQSEPFYPRALYLAFARVVTAKQVTETLAVQLKLLVSENTFRLFSAILLGGVGLGGMAKHETLTFFWPKSSTLRVFVRGAFVGEVEDESLPRVMFHGFLGPEPHSAAAKAALPAGAAALFRQELEGIGKKR